jgi:protein TonB
VSRVSRRQAFHELSLCGISLFVVVASSGSAQSDGGKESKGKKDPDKQDSDNTVYTPGGDVTTPKLIHYVEPRFSPSSKEAYVEGVVRISTVVNPAGLPTDLHIVEGLNSEEDGTAIEAVKQWRFQPGTKQGHPVHVKVTVQIEFHLL